MQIPAVTPIAFEWFKSVELCFTAVHFVPISVNE
jgi:hypothetical protein